MPHLPYFNILLIKSLILATGIYATGLKAQTEPSLDLIFHPDYRLGGKAANYPGPRIDPPHSLSDIAGPLSPPLTLKGMPPTERIIDFTDQIFF